MGEKTTIGWTHATFNPWWGCEKVSPGCTNCYAERDSHRRGWAVWGKEKPRRFFSDEHWKGPLKWDRAAAKAGERRRVFCASMADVFEDRPDLVPWRSRLWHIIEATPNLDWLLLTKRPENVRAMVRGDWLVKPRPNVWLGTSAEDQERAAERIPVLLEIPAQIRFISAEPLLGELDLAPYLQRPGGLDWVITGGESGPNFRPLREWWLHKIVQDCQAAKVPVFVKQLGRIVLVGETATVRTASATQAMRLVDPKGGDPAEWPVELRVREFPA
jgi:protein gp37